MKQKRRKAFRGGDGLLEMAPERLVSEVNRIRGEGLKVIVLDDGTLTRDALKSSVQGTPGEDYCVISADLKKEFKKNTYNS